MFHAGAIYYGVSYLEALAKYTPDSIRLYFLSSHYRSPLSYTEEGCDAMERSADRLRHSLRPGPETESRIEPLDPAPFREQFMAAMDDDLNTPRALAAMFDLSRKMNRQRDEGHSIAAAQDCLRHLGSILGLTFRERELPLNIDAASYNAFLVILRGTLTETGQSGLAGLIRDEDEADLDLVSGQHIDLLITIRTACRESKQYTLADEIRGWLDSHGVSVEDSASGSIWEYRPSS